MRVTFYDPARAISEFMHLLEAHGHPRFDEPAWHLALRLTDERDTAARYADVKRQAHYDYDGRNSSEPGSAPARIWWQEVKAAFRRSSPYAVNVFS